eukprot:Nitzschia sp. Nitz4//scaffold66_size103028//14141//15813//NITZ4_004490-RA/size103028-snap-gene-0.132-mRNA-1//-1//CDS//3329556326//2151//frame0
MTTSAPYPHMSGSGFWCQDSQCNGFCNNLGGNRMDMLHNGEALNLAGEGHPRFSSQPFPQKSPTSSNQNPHEMISEALNSLTLKERDRLFNEIHGVDERAEELASMETAPFLLQQLQNFEVTLQQYKLSKQGDPILQALLLAEHMNPTFVQDPKLRLPFLRTRDWDVPKAVECFVRYFDLKNVLFGEAKLTKVLDIDDLDAEDLRLMKEGSVQVLTTRDRAGRPICVGINQGEGATSISLVRQMFVFGLTDEETQRRGWLYISIRLMRSNETTQQAASAIPLINRIISDMPIRYTAFHYCTPGEGPFYFRNNLLLELSLQLMSRHMRARVRVHRGSMTEWCYELLTFGVPVQLLPLTADFKIKTKNHLEFLDMRFRAAAVRRQSNFTIEPVLVPTNKDILLGKGKPIQLAIGNQRLSDYIDSLMEERQRGGTFGKAVLATMVVQHVHLSGGRFLSKDSGVWLPVSDDIALDKVGNMLRHRRSLVIKD